MIDKSIEDALVYLDKFIIANYDSFFADMQEYQPHNGYGLFYYSNDVVQGMRDIVHNLSDVFSSPSIPEGFASPDDFKEKIENYIVLLEKQNAYIKELIEYFKKQNSSIPDPVAGFERMNNKTLKAFQFINSKLMRIEKSNDFNSGDKKIELIFEKFSSVVSKFQTRRTNLKKRKEALVIEDEYDVQYILGGLLSIFFDDIREEEWAPSCAGSSKRMDYLLKKEEIVVEVKCTRKGLKDKELGEQLLIDIANYKNHANCKTLFCFIYDNSKLIRNPIGLISDLEKHSTTDFKIKIFIC